MTIESIMCTVMNCANSIIATAPALGEERTVEQDAHDIGLIYMLAKTIVDTVEGEKKTLGDIVTRGMEVGTVDIGEVRYKKYIKTSTDIEALRNNYPHLYTRCIDLVPKVNATKLKAELEDMDDSERRSFHDATDKVTKVVEVRLTGGS